ncbi:hypothetical protein QM272_19760, partial [Acinetobacter baumannii]|uniref:hypothetical protein n=1 Tax=Acinetobacter baumannii TaxID=470 RepID=UPI0024B8423E
SLISGVYFNYVIGIDSQNIDSPTNPVRFNIKNRHEVAKNHGSKNCPCSFCGKPPLGFNMLIHL